jgi:type IV pilus assembly protein PilM
MLGFVQNFFAPKSNPIGVDFGSDCLRMVQVQRGTGSDGGSEFKLVAAASADVPAHVRHDPGARLNFFIESTRDLLTQANFRGRQCVLGLPAASMFIQHLRMPKLDAEAMKKALPWELRGKLPIDPSHAQLRHIVAGDVFEGQESKSEVIVIAAAREMINQLLAAAAKAKLDIVGMNVEPKAIVDCFSQLYRRKSDDGLVNCYVDVGCVSTRAVVARGTEILFARTIPVGGDHFSRATANALKIKLDEAKMLRVKLATLIAAATPATPINKPVAPEAAKRQAPAEVPVPSSEDRSIDNSFALLPAGVREDRRRNDLAAANALAASVAAALMEPPAAPAGNGLDPTVAKQVKQVEEACKDSLNRLVEELELCRRYYETTFTDKPVQRLIFIGGEARQKTLCQHIARTMGLAAQVGDPMPRMRRDNNGDDGIECLDKRQQHPAWSVAIGLSMGPNAKDEGGRMKAEEKAKAEA